MGGVGMHAPDCRPPAAGTIGRPGAAPPEELRRADRVPAERDQPGAEDARLEVHAVLQPAPGAAPQQEVGIAAQPHLLQQHHVLRGAVGERAALRARACVCVPTPGTALQAAPRPHGAPGTAPPRPPTALHVVSHSPRCLRGARPRQRDGTAPPTSLRPRRRSPHALLALFRHEPEAPDVERDDAEALRHLGRPGSAMGLRRWLTQRAIAGSRLRRAAHAHNAELASSKRKPDPHRRLRCAAFKYSPRAVCAPAACGLPPPASLLPSRPGRKPGQRT
jgi:hypothetical protein